MLCIENNLPLKSDDLSGLVEKFLTFAQVKSASVKSYRKGIKNLANFFSLQGISQPTRENLIAYREYLAENYSAATCNLYLTSAKLFFNFLFVEGILKENPAEHLKGLKIDRSTHKKDALSSDMVKAILATFDTSTLQGKRDKAIFALMATAGLRTVEIIRADVDDIAEKSGKYFLYVQGKGRNDKSECVQIAPSVYSLISDYLQARTDNGENLFASLSHRNFGGRLNSTTISILVKDIMRRAGFDSERLTAHSLRHTAATVALQAGASLRQVQQVLRHKSVSVTEIYLHDLDRLTNNAESLVAEVFDI